MRNTTIAIDHGNCDAEGLCADVCPMRIFSHEEKQVPTVSGEDHCVLCGQCVAVCPNDAISHSALDKAQFRPVSEMPETDADVIAALLRRRRSVRTYKKKLIPRAELEEIVILLDPSRPVKNSGVRYYYPG